MVIYMQTFYSFFIPLIAMMILSGCLNQSSKKFIDIKAAELQITNPRFNIVINNYCVPKSTKRVNFNLLNRNYHLTAKGVMADIDSDGIIDMEEETEVAALFGISSKHYDTNQDKYSDAIVYNGMITLQNQSELPQCNEGDLDQDGLPDCAEYVVGSDPEKTDSDGDGIPDELEIFIGLSPLIKDSHIDTDMDGLSNYEELLLRTPLYEHNKLGSIDTFKLHYELIPEINDAEKDCYTYKVQNISYQVKRANNNLVEIYFTEEINGMVKHSKYSRLILWSEIQKLHKEIMIKGKKDELPTFTIEYADLIKKD